MRTSSWIDAVKTPPPAMQDVLLYADGEILLGWNESVQPEEDSSYCVALRDSRSCMSLENVTHWMQLPKKPNEL